MIRFKRYCHVADLGTGFRKNQQAELDEPLEHRLIDLGFAEMVSESSDEEDDASEDQFPPTEEVVELLTGVTKAEQDEFWGQYELDVLNNTLLVRFEEPVTGRNHGQAANMLAERMEVPAATDA